MHLLLSLLLIAACAPAPEPIQRPKPRPACVAMISSAVATEAGHEVTGLGCVQ